MAAPASAKAKIDRGGVIRIAASKSKVLKRNPRMVADFFGGVLGVIIVSTNVVQMIIEEHVQQINV